MSTPTAAPESDIFGRIQADALRRVAPPAGAPGAANATIGPAAGSNLFIHKERLPQGFVIRAGVQEITIKRETVLVFADDAPLYNWAHPCRYLLYAHENGQLYDEVKAAFPPKLAQSPAFQAFHQPVAFARQDEGAPVAALGHLASLGVKFRLSGPGKAYALLYSGHSDNRHVNDLEFLYRTLVTLYDFAPERIFVLNYDGTLSYTGAKQPINWPGDNTAYRMKITGAGTRAALDQAFDQLKAVLGGDDILLFHTNNHGSHNGTEATLCSHNPQTQDWGQEIPASHIAEKIGQLPPIARLIVMMEQCHAGGFNAPILAHSTAAETTVASACAEDKNSMGGALYDPFARDWIASLTGLTPGGQVLSFDPDADHNRMVSVAEAFTYANDAKVKHPDDTPVYSEKPAGSGKHIFLGRPETRVVRAPATPVIGVCRDPNKLDVFVVGNNGTTYAAAWEQTVASGRWRGWWSINGGQAVAHAPLNAISRAHNKLDAFVVGSDGAIYTAAWEEGYDQFVGNWRGWWPIVNGRARPGSLVGAVARDPNKLDVFVAGTDGAIYTAAWDHNVANGQWRGWWPIVNGRTVPGGAVTAVARDPNKLDVFTVGTDGVVYTAAWDQNVAGGNWRGWWPIGNFHARPGSLVGVVARDRNKLDVFAASADGAICTAAWDQNVAGGNWRGWWPIVNGRTVPGGAVTAVARDPNKLDVFTVGADGVVYTAAWDQNVAGAQWRGWWPIVNGHAQPGAQVSAVARDPNKLDVFTVGTDSAIYTAAWDQNVAGAQWRGWWRITD